MKIFLAFILGLIAMPVCLVAAGMFGLLGSTGTSEPPGWEAALGDRLLDTALEKRAKGLTNPIRAGDVAALTAGRKLYRANCSGCHGTSAAPSEWGSRNFYPRVPQFWQAGKRAERLSPEEAYAAIHDGIRYSGMGAWKGQMTDGDMWKVANFVAHISDIQTPPSSEKGH